MNSCDRFLFIESGRTIYVHSRCYVTFTIHTHKSTVCIEVLKTAKKKVTQYFFLFPISIIFSTHLTQRPSGAMSHREMSARPRSSTRTLGWPRIKKKEASLLE